MRSQEKEGIGALKEGVYVKVFTEGTDLRRWQGLLLHIDVVPAQQKEGSKECHRLISSAYRFGPKRKTRILVNAGGGG